MFKNIKKKLKAVMTGKSGFSLVELIVVIAIMAVMAAVLAPALLGYVEKSRMQKDGSAMDEVINAMQLSLADQAIYDEVLEHSVWDNVSCYIDKKDESQFASHKVTLKAANGDKKEQYMFSDEARLLDETVYYAAGNMRGLTITWSPSESGDTYDFANGILNKFVGRKTGLLSENPELYNRLRSVIGDKLDTTSQTYRNSDYTIFIRVGSTGGSEAVMQDAIQVWGQFNGTNLTEKDHKYELSSGRVVGSAGANDAANNQTNNENDNMNFTESYSSQLTTLTVKEWNSPTSFAGMQIWTDGTNTYYSNGSKHFVLNGDTWDATTWTGLTSFHGSGVRNYNGTTYLFTESEIYRLNNKNWEFVQDIGVPDLGGIWTDGTKYYCSRSGEHYVLNNGQWESKTWNGLTDIDGYYIWNDRKHIYYSDGDVSYVLNGDTWEVKDWNIEGLTAYRIWTDGKNIYYSNNEQQYILNGNVWEPKVWNGFTNIKGNQVWTDGVNYYYSFDGNNYIFS